MAHVDEVYEFVEYQRKDFRIPNVLIGDEAVSFGNQCGTVLSADELAGILGTINYKIVSRIGRRVPRVHTDKGEIVSVRDYLA